MNDTWNENCISISSEWNKTRSFLLFPKDVCRFSIRCQRNSILITIIIISIIAIVIINIGVRIEAGQCGEERSGEEKVIELATRVTRIRFIMILINIIDVVVVISIIHPSGIGRIVLRRGAADGGSIGIGRMRMMRVRIAVHEGGAARKIRRVRRRSALRYAHRAGNKSHCG